MSSPSDERSAGLGTAGQLLGLPGGGQATLAAHEGEQATIEAPFASPPGATVELLVLGAPARLKVRRCQRIAGRDSGGVLFRIDGRWLSLSRAQREALEAGAARRG